MNQKQSHKQRSRVIFRLFLALFLGAILSFSFISGPRAADCDGCVPGDPQAAADHVRSEHKDGRTFITDQFKKHQNWLIDDFFKKHVFPAMADMTVQLVSVGMQQVMAIGMFLDAEQQLETQRNIPGIAKPGA